MTERIIPTPDPQLSTEVSKSAAYEASRTVKATGAGVLYGLNGYNSGAAQFIQIHDKASAPANTDVPLLVLAAGGTSNFSADFGAYGIPFRLGCYIVNSSTGPTLTAGGNDCFITARFK